MTDVVTTFNEQGRILYGDRFVETWLRYWPKNYRLVVYTENLSVKLDDVICQIDLETACPDLKIFKKHCTDRAQQALDRRSQNYFLKACKWSHKVFAMHHALMNARSRYVIWLDADTYTTSPVPQDWVSPLLQGACFAAHSEHTRHGWHIESGLVVFDREHLDANTVQKMLIQPYIEPYDIFNLPKPWDSFWLWALSRKVLFKDLRSSGVFGHPLVKPYLTHDVGKRKYKQAGINPYTLNKN